MSKAQPWEIWWAYVAFEDIDDGKVFGDYDITKWQSAGLKKPSTIRLTRQLRLEEEDLIYKMGDFSLSTLLCSNGICDWLPHIASFK